VSQGKLVADASLAANIKHLIFSSLGDIRAASGGRLSHLRHVDSKVAIEAHIRSIGVPASFVFACYYMSNFLQFMPRGEDGGYTYAMPVAQDRAQFPLIDATADFGKFVKPALVYGPEEVARRVKDGRILAAVGYYSGKQVVEEFEEASGKKMRWVELDHQTYMSYLPEPMRQEMLDNHLALESPGLVAGESLEPSLKLVESVDETLTSWSEFVKKQKTWTE